MDVRIRPLSAVPDEVAVLAPGSMGNAALWMGWAAILNTRLCIRDVSLNPHELSFVDLLVRMGVRVREEVQAMNPGKWTGNLEVRGARLRGIMIPSHLVGNVREELGILAVVAALASGQTTIRAAALKQQSPMVQTLCSGLRSMRVAVDEYEDGLVVSGSQILHGAVLECRGDVRLAMAFSVAGLAAKGETILRDTGEISAVYPGFYRDVFPGQFD